MNSILRDFQSDDPPVSDEEQVAKNVAAIAYAGASYPPSVPVTGSEGLPMLQVEPIRSVSEQCRGVVYIPDQIGP